MEEGWRWEAKAALCCVLLLPAWMWVTGLNSDTFWEVVLCGLLGFGVGFGLSGARRGSRASRWVAAVCLAVLLVVAVGYVILVRTDPWLYP
jgi:hypothetical protein